MSTIDRDTTTAWPPLRDGQRLDRATFHDRYEAMPPGSKAELIGGVVHMPSPVGLRHSQFQRNTLYWATHYAFRTPGTSSGVDASVFLDDLGEPQPDVHLRIKPEFGGQTHHPGKYIGGAPELVIEVSDSTRATDLGPKLADYQRAGVREYLVLLIQPDEVAWHVRHGDRLLRVPPDADGLYRSRVFPGLWLDPHALLKDDGPAMLAALERGLASPEHAAFLAHLLRQRQRQPDA